MFHVSQTSPVVDREHLIDPDQGLFVVDDPVYSRERHPVRPKALLFPNSKRDNSFITKMVSFGAILVPSGGR